MQQWYKCPNCGAPVASGAKFCGNCGTQVNWLARQLSQPQHSPVYQPPCKKNWFRRHLNWTWIFVYFIWFYLSATTSDHSPLALPSVVGSGFLLIISGWVIKQKGRSLWWIFLTPLFSPVWLKNRSLDGQGYRQTIGYVERQECLAYYEEEKKLRLLYERVEQLFDKRLGKYEDAYFQARKALMKFLFAGTVKNDTEHVPAMEIMETIFQVRGYMSQAATEIVKRKKTMGPAPLAASAMSSAWLAVYLDYEAKTDPSCIIAGYNIIEVEAKRLKAKELFTNLNSSLRKAWKEEKKFRKHLRLSDSEYEQIIDYAAVAVAADEWLWKLEAECP